MNSIFIRIFVFFCICICLSCSSNPKKRSADDGLKIKNIFDAQEISSILQKNEKDDRKSFEAIEHSAKEKIPSERTRLHYYHWLKSALNDINDSWGAGNGMNELIDKHQAESAILFAGDAEKISALKSTHSMSSAPGFASSGHSIYPSIYQLLGDDEPTTVLKKNFEYQFEFPQEIYPSWGGRNESEVKWKLKAHLGSASHFLAVARTREIEGRGRLHYIIITSAKTKKALSVTPNEPQLLTVEIDQGPYLRRYFWKVKIVD